MNKGNSEKKTSEEALIVKTLYRKCQFWKPQILQSIILQIRNLKKDNYDKEHFGDGDSGPARKKLRKGNFEKEHIWELKFCKGKFITTTILEDTILKTDNPEEDKSNPDSWLVNPQ